MRYKDYGIVVTGGAHGIGKAIVEEFVNEGAKVCYIDKNQGCFDNQHVFYFQGDVSQKDDLESFVDFCHHKLNRIDVLVNNACVFRHGLLSDCSYEDFDYILSLGIKAPYYLSLMFKDDLIHSNGNIINMASTRAFQSEPNSEPYASAKGGIVALTHALSMSLAGKVRVNCIAPGWIDVYQTLAFSKEDESAIPAGRVGKPKDISKMVLFLCSEDANFITGETFVVDGGMSKRMIYHGDYGWEYHI